MSSAFERSIICPVLVGRSYQVELLHRGIEQARAGKGQAAKREFGGLTERERAVASLIAQGKSNRDIAEAMVLSRRTVETHIGNIMAKLGFERRAQIIVWAIEKGLVEPGA